MIISVPQDVDWSVLSVDERRRAIALMVAKELYPTLAPKDAVRVARYIRNGQWSCGES